MSEEKPLKELIDKLLVAYGYQDQLDEIALLEFYKEVAGKFFSNHTKEVSYRQNVLFVVLDSPTLKHEMSFIKERLIEGLNRKMKKRILKDIVIR